MHNASIQPQIKYTQPPFINVLLEVVTTIAHPQLGICYEGMEIAQMYV
jgi:hypothetical protein